MTCRFDPLDTTGVRAGVHVGGGRDVTKTGFEKNNCGVYTVSMFINETRTSVASLKENVLYGGVI